MKTLVKILLLIPLLTLGGCYTQLALRDSYDYDDEYTYQEQEDTTYSENRGEVNIYNYYYDGFYPRYRRYYWGYYPSWSITIGTYYDPFWWDVYYPYVPWWYYPYPYSYWAYYDNWYYPNYWYYGYSHTGVYKYRNTYTRLRDTDGGRSGDIRNRGDSYRNGRTTIIDSRSGVSKPVDVDLSRTGVSRTKDNSSGTLSKEGANTNVERKRERTGTRIKYPVEATRDREARERNSDGSRGNSSERERSSSDNSSSGRSSQPSYTPPPSESRAPAPSYNPPPRSSSGSGSTRGSDGGRSGGDGGRRR